MAVYVNTIPQKELEIRILTITKLIKALPEQLAYDLDVWIDGKLVRYGKTTENLTFLIKMDTEPSCELMEYFNTLVEPLKFNATASNNWKNNNLSVLKLYNNGKLIIDKKTMTYKELPSVIEEDRYEIKYEEVLNKMPKEIEFKQTIYLTGGLVRNGFSNNDVDFIVFDIGIDEIFQIRQFFNNILKLKVHVGTFVMTNREPVYLYKLYENGILCQHE
jgi:hypothetical protein